MITHLDGTSATLLPTIDAALKTRISVPVADSVVNTWTVHNWNEINERLKSSKFKCAGLLFYINLERKSDTGVGIHLRPPKVLPVDVLDIQYGFLMSHPLDPSKRSHIWGAHLLIVTSPELTV